MEKRYQLSQNVHVICDLESETAMAYHTLYGNPRILNNEALQFLDLFTHPATAKEISEICDEDPVSTIQEFAEIFFLVETGFDEKEFLFKQRAQHLQQVHEKKTIDRMGLAISDFCNFSCAHCIHFQPSNNGGLASPAYKKPIKQLNMSWVTAKTCINHYIALMRKQGRYHCRIHFGNAEPLTNWQVIEKVLQYCADQNDLIFDFAINTNLSLLTREIAEVLKKYKVRIATSLDGTSEANDAIRITKGGKGTFSQILKKFDMLAEIDYPLDGFSITVTDGNFNLINTGVIELAYQRKMKAIAFDYDLVNLVGIPLINRVEKLMCLKKYANERGIDFFGTWDSAFRNLTSESLIKGNHAFCAAVEGKALEFNVDGSIKVCSHTTTRIGHVDNFNQVFQKSGDLLKLIQERFPGSDSRCSGCVIEGSCGGQCHVTREVASNLNHEGRESFFADMCDFYRMITEKLALEYIRSGGASAVVNRQICSI